MSEPIVIGEGHWLFESESHPGEYHVYDSELGCSCLAALVHGYCWHQTFIQERYGGTQAIDQQDHSHLPG